MLKLLSITSVISYGLKLLELISVSTTPIQVFTLYTQFSIHCLQPPGIEGIRPWLHVTSFIIYHWESKIILPFHFSPL